VASIDELRNRIMSVHKLVAVETMEEDRVCSEIFNEFAEEADILTWTPSFPLNVVTQPIHFSIRNIEARVEVDDGPLEVIEYIAKTCTTIQEDGKPAKSDNRVKLFILRDMPIGGNQTPQGARIARRIKDILPVIGKVGIIIIGATIDVDPTLERDYHLIRWKLKNKDEHMEWARKRIESWKEAVETTLRDGNSRKTTWLGGDKIPLESAFKLDYSEKEMAEIGGSLTGLTETEANRSLSFSLKTFGELDPTVLSEAKMGIIEKSGMLEWFDPKDIPPVGGMDLLKEWLRKRGRAMNNPEAWEYGLPSPRGCILLGPSGSGKSLTAKNVARQWGLPLIKLEMGAVMDRWVGSSERNMRQILNILDSLHPLVLWLDEMEKALSGYQSSGVSDSGTFSRVFQQLLTWANDRESAIFLVATCNAMIGRDGSLLLPPELKRAGRFDAIFHVDIPCEEEAKEIVQIHIAHPRAGHQGRDPSMFDIDAIAAHCYKEQHRYTGAEYEAAWINALHAGYDDGVREPTTEDFLRELDKLRPVSYTEIESIRALREFGKDKCLQASSQMVRRVESSAKTGGLTTLSGMDIIN